MSWLRSVLALAVLCAFSTAMAIAQQSAPAAPVAAGDVLAVVNGHTITRQDAEQMEQNMRQHARGQAEPDKRRIMQELITLELLAQEGMKQRLDQEPDIRTQLKLRTNNILARAMVQKYVAEQIDLTDEAFQHYYDASKDRYTVGEQVSASHILVRTEQEAHDVLQEVRAGKDFAEVAKAKSIGPSAAKGGALGTFGRGRMVPQFEAAVFALKKGDIGGPVKTQFGFHIVKVTDRIAAHTKSLDEVREEIRRELVSQHLTAYFDKLHSNAKVEIKDPSYAPE